jgi:magnesium-protoporphyrin O-methyltransferase
VTGCCARHGQEELFTEKGARRAARRYREKGADPMARSLARRAAERGVEGATVLEIGGGVGEVLLELLQRGAAQGEVVELVPAYEPEARALAAEAGVGDRAGFRTADLVADPDAAEPADLVVLNKVVCCTPDGVELAGIAARLTRRTLVLSHPRETWLVRLGLGGANLFMRLTRKRFRVFLHPRAALEAAVEAQGLRPASAKDGVLWRVAAFERP